MVLIRLLLEHEGVSEILPVSSSLQGRAVHEGDPGVRAGWSDKIPNSLYTSLEEIQEDPPEVVFSALPHLESAKRCSKFVDRSTVIDLSADYRLGDPEHYKSVYGARHPVPEQLSSAVYGLSELSREKLKRASIIANPGCFPTATLLPLVPVIRRFGCRGEIVVTAISGLSGAGRGGGRELNFSERSESCGAYNPGRLHRHLWEIEGQLQHLAQACPVLFTPHTAPLRRGIAATTHLHLNDEVTEEVVEECLSDTFGEEPFIQLCPGEIPKTSQVRGTNRCDIGWRVFGKTVMLFSVIDNLVKGAAGQAIQNMNIRFNFKETMGLPVVGEV